MRRFLIFDVMALGVLAAHAIPFEDARREALFLTDKMAYELNVNEARATEFLEVSRRSMKPCMKSTSTTSCPSRHHAM